MMMMNGHHRHNRKPRRRMGETEVKLQQQLRMQLSVKWDGHCVTLHITYLQRDGNYNWGAQGPSVYHSNAYQPCSFERALICPQVCHTQINKASQVKVKVQL
jgi:hypothetical protein